MAKIQNAANSTEESIGIAMSRTELFFEKNGKALTLGLIVLVLLGGLWVGYRNLVSKPRHEKAVEAADNNATAPIFLMKAGRAYKALGDTAKAKECFERIATAYPSSFEARDIEKYINSL